MNLSNSLRNSLLSGFDIATRESRCDRSFGVSVVADKIGGMLFVPTMCAKQVIDVISVRGSTVRGGIVMPLSRPSREVKKTSNAIISRLYNSESWYDGVHRNFSYIDTTKGYGYYGSRGIILDDNHLPLMICGFEVQLFPITRVPCYKFIRPICLISSRVFEREDMVSKVIVKKVMPYLSGKKMYMWDSMGRTQGEEGRMKIIVSDELDKFIHVATPPSEMDIDDTIYNILDEFISEIRR